LTTESEHVKESEGMGNKGGLGLVGLFFPDVSTLPFTLIALDFIIKLSLSEGFNSILTITDTFTDYHVSSQIDTPISLPLSSKNFAASPNAPIRKWNNTLGSLSTTIRQVGKNGYHWQNICSMPGPMPPPRKPLLS
jgi:hypothetical protein